MSTIAVTYTRSDQPGRDEKRNYRGPLSDDLFKRFFESIAPRGNWSGSNGTFTVVVRGVTHTISVDRTADPAPTRLPALP